MNSSSVIVDLPDGTSEKEIVVQANEKKTVVLRAYRMKNVDARITVRLTGRGAGATIVGFIIGSGTSSIRLHTLQVHEAPETSSDLLVKTVLFDETKCFIEGGIRVEKDAQKTDAYQRNENLLLSPEAYAESKPALEILANDVRCTHGATVSPVSEEELWYMGTRGISREKALPLIVGGFLTKAADRISDEQLKLDIRHSVEQVL